MVSATKTHPVLLLVSATLSRGLMLEVAAMFCNLVVRTKLTEIGSASPSLLLVYHSRLPGRGTSRSWIDYFARGKPRRRQSMGISKRTGRARVLRRGPTGKEGWCRVKRGLRGPRGCMRPRRDDALALALHLCRMHRDVPLSRLYECSHFHRIYEHGQLCRGVRTRMHSDFVGPTPER
jgi:hypothetical protein